MKTYKNLFEPMLKPDIVAKCALNAAVGKTHRKEVLDAFKHFDKTFDFVVACARNPNYIPCEDNIHEIIDGAHNKKREIEKPKRYGVHAAVKRLKKWVQVGKKIYVCETDIHHAYGSVHIATLARQMERVIKDQGWLRLTYQFLHYKKPDEELRGLILGHYTSPWFFNFYLKEFDHFAATLEGIKYLRFADNLYLIGTNKKKVHKALDAIREYLRVNLKLELNHSTQVYRFEYVDRHGKVRGRAVNALGMVIHYNRVTLRKSLLRGIRRKALKIGHKVGVTWHDAASMLSRLSWIRHTNTYTYYKKYVKPHLNTKILKNKIRRHSKKIMPVSKERRRIINDGLENSTRYTGK